MRCSLFGAVIRVKTCISRQEESQKLEGKKESGNSLHECFSCEQGKRVMENPKGFISKDIERIIFEEIQKAIKEGRIKPNRIIKHKLKVKRIKAPKFKLKKRIEENHQRRIANAKR